MRILFTCEAFAPDFLGGGEYVTLETARHLRGRGLDVRVLTTGDPGVAEYGGMPTERLPVSRYAMNLAVRRIVRAAQGAELIQTFNFHACLPSLIAGRLLGIPVLCTVLGLFDGEWLGLRGPLVGRAYRAWERFLVSRRFDRTIFLSDFSRTLGERLGADPRRSAVIAPGIDLDAHRPHPVKEQEVLFVGKFEPRKGIDDLLAVARALPHVRFRAVGWGERLAAYRRSAPPNLVFETFERGARLSERFARASVFFFPSRAETFGLVVAQAMAAGCAVVSTVPLGFAGEPVQPGDQARMAALLDGLIRDPARTRELGERNRVRARVFRWETHADALVRLYEEVLAERRTAHGQVRDA